MVEDHFLNQIATKRVLTTWSPYITVDIAENGLIGVEKFFEHGYDIVFDGLTDASDGRSGSFQKNTRKKFCADFRHDGQLLQAGSRQMLQKRHQ